jgi:hypothetical protein
MHCIRAYFFFFLGIREEKVSKRVKNAYCEICQRSQKIGENAGAYVAERPILEKTFLKLKIRGL